MQIILNMHIDIICRILEASLGSIGQSPNCTIGVSNAVSKGTRKQASVVIAWKCDSLKPMSLTLRARHAITISPVTYQWTKSNIYARKPSQHLSLIFLC
jgi:hypothetical protein